MPADTRPALWTLGAFKHVIETIPNSVSDPALGYMRLTWWRDQIEKLGQGDVTKGQPILAALSVIASEARLYQDLSDFINEHESAVENPKVEFISNIYPKLLEDILGSHIVKYRKLENRLTKILKSHHGSKWEHNPPFLALRLWVSSLF